MSLIRKNFYLFCFTAFFAANGFWLAADITINSGNIRTDNSTQTDFPFDPDNDGTAESILDSGGNLGLGTLTPSANVDVVGDLFVSGELITDGDVLLSNGNLQHGLVGWWSFDDLDSSGNVIDHSGEGNAGTPTNGPKHTDGKFGNAFEYDNSNDYVIYGNQDAHNFGTGDFTVCLWIYRYNNPTGNLRAFSKGGTNDTAGEAGYSFYGNDYGITFAVNPTGARTHASGNHLPNEWFFAVGVVERGVSQRLYINSILKATQTAPVGSVTGSSELNIGRASNGSGSLYWDGLVDEVHLYNRALSDSEITALYTHNQAKFAKGGTLTRTP